MSELSFPIDNPQDWIVGDGTCYFPSIDMDEVKKFANPSFARFSEPITIDIGEVKKRIQELLNE